MSEFPPGDPLPLPVVAHTLGMQWRCPAIDVYRRLCRSIAGAPGSTRTPATPSTVQSVVVQGEIMIPRAEAQRLLALRSSAGAAA